MIVLIFDVDIYNFDKLCVFLSRCKDGIGKLESLKVYKKSDVCFLKKLVFPFLCAS